MDADLIPKIVDAVLNHRPPNRWLLPGTREEMIKAGRAAKNPQRLCEAFEQILREYEIDDPSSDPCDECWHDRWFYYHPSMVI